MRVAKLPEFTHHELLEQIAQVHNYVIHKHYKSLHICPLQAGKLNLTATQKVQTQTSESEADCLYGVPVGQNKIPAQVTMTTHIMHIPRSVRPLDCVQTLRLYTRTSEDPNVGIVPPCV